VPTSIAKSKVGSVAAQYQEALAMAVITHGVNETVTLDQWKDAARRAGLLSKYETARKQDQMFSKYKLELIAAKIVVVKDDRVGFAAGVAETATPRSADDIFGESK
jgi:hypothetical protein